MIKFIRNVIIIAYAIIAIFVTICLLSYNDQKVTVLGSYALVIIDNNELEPNYNKGDLAIVSGSGKINEGDSIFFYNTKAKDFEVAFAKVEKKEVITEKETTYIINGNTRISSEFVVGSSENTTSIAKVGTILQVLESKWGFLLLVILPALMAFLYQVIEVIAEVKNSKNVSGNEKEKN